MRKWKDIRDSFVKSRRRSIMGMKNGKEVREYKYSKDLEFLLPHIRTREGTINISGEYYGDDKEDPEESMQDNKVREAVEAECENGSVLDQEQPPTLAPRDPSESGEFVARRSKRRLMESEELVDHDCNLQAYPNDPKFRKSDDDEDDIFFKSMALVCKRLPPRAKSTIKFEIHKLIHEAEIELLATGPTHSYLVIPDGRCTTPISSCPGSHASTVHHSHHDL